VPRIIRQGGVFTVSSDPKKGIDELLRDNEELEVITISKEYRKGLLEDLFLWRKYIFNIPRS
jgi:hypothetical protein